VNRGKAQDADTIPEGKRGEKGLDFDLEIKKKRKKMES